jgi:hypothetical protein
MRTPIAATIQPDGGVYLYDSNGHYCGARMANSGKAVSAVMNGSDLVITTDKGKIEVFKSNSGGSYFLKFTR